MSGLCLVHVWVRMGFVSGGCLFCVCFVSFCVWFVSEFLFGSCPGVRLRLMFASCLFRNRFVSISGPFRYGFVFGLVSGWGFGSCVWVYDWFVFGSCPFHRRFSGSYLFRVWVIFDSYIYN